MITWLLLTWNSANYVRAALENAAGLVNEIVAIDSHSTDETIDILKEFDARIFERELNNSFGDLRNFGIEQAKGDWILILDTDEYFLEETKHLIPGLIVNPKVDCFVFGRLNYLDGILQKAPDFHYRLFRSYCRYTEGIHEQIYGFKESKVMEEIKVAHRKTWKRQEEQDARYKEMIEK